MDITNGMFFIDLKYEGWSDEDEKAEGTPISLEAPLMGTYILL